MYHKFKDDEGKEYGSFEVFKHDGNDPDFVLNPDEPTKVIAPAGWYWWACFPGCLPDGDPNGPFETEEEATNDAQSR